MKIAETSPYAVGAKLYRIGPDWREEPPLHVVAVLTDTASDPWPWLLVTRRWRPAKQRWEHEILNPLEVLGGSAMSRESAMYYPTRESARAAMERGH